ncbi:hypothetical protein [Herbidospora sp. NBRC 101105]|uniref:hypothetical protein n=1 Tax=Herbidospora sp. NBRC 101105 TaxID=3032195 RepID=UPI0024A3265C|nr:hypothetical protein [Herbidospora sp. NBRC 101105]GLX94176.1 hypothetical protein Hesp01_21260 [Herbidospora sp. NBRC 101105]
MDGLDEVIDRLAALTGVDMGAERDDEHKRWELYRRALDDLDESRAELLREVVRLEGDDEIALSVALRVLPVVPSERRPGWVNQLADERNRRYADNRRADLDLLDRFRELPDGADVECDVTSWSQWLQLRMALHVEHAGVLEQLAGSGSTKRIRRTAGERLSR